MAPPRLLVKAEDGPSSPSRGVGREGEGGREEGRIERKDIEIERERTRSQGRSRGGREGEREKMEREKLL
jgi:hypothetical protein